MQNYKSWKRTRPAKQRTGPRPKPYEPSLPGLFTRTSGMMRSDPSYWQERREDEAEATERAAQQYGFRSARDFYDALDQNTKGNA